MHAFQKSRAAAERRTAETLRRRAARLHYEREAAAAEELAALDQAARALQRRGQDDALDWDGHISADDLAESGALDHWTGE